MFFKHYVTITLRELIDEKITRNHLVNYILEDIQMAGKSNCDYCMNYSYDEEEEYYKCLVDLDEDEYERFLRNSLQSCPYFRMGDEYKIVKKQM